MKYPKYKIQKCTTGDLILYKVLKRHKFLWFIPYYYSLFYYDNEEQCHDLTFTNEQLAKNYIKTIELEEKTRIEMLKRVQYTSIPKPKTITEIIEEIYI